MPTQTTTKTSLFTTLVSPSTATYWLCHYCIYIVAPTSAVFPFGNTACAGCGHERCGLCDVVYGTSGEGEEGALRKMRYHWEQEGVKASVKVPVGAEDVLVQCS